MRRISRRALVAGVAASSLPAGAHAGSPEATLHRSLARYRPLLLSGAPAPSDARPLHARFMGTSTVLLEAGGARLLVDGFFSRPGFLGTVFSRIEPDSARIEAALRRARAEDLDAVLTAHAHYDHALDAPDVADLKTATLVGSESVRRIAGGHGFKGRFEPLKRDARTVLDLAGFRVTAVPSPHSPRSLFRGDVEEPIPREAWFGRYREGGNFSFHVERDGRSVLVHPSSGAVRGAFEGLRAEVVFFGVGSLGGAGDDFFDRYWREVVTGTQAEWVIPIHWDNFFRPLDQGLAPLPWPLDRVKAALRRVVARPPQDGVRVGFMPLFDAVPMPPARYAP